MGKELVLVHSRRTPVEEQRQHTQHSQVTFLSSFYTKLVKLQPLISDDRFNLLNIN